MNEVAGSEELAPSPCLICLTRRPPAEGTRPPDVQFQCDHFDDACLETDLFSIFLLRKLLQFPREECEKLLISTFGVSPGKWCAVCRTCLQVVAKAYKVCQQIGMLERELEGLRGLLMENMERSYSMEETTLGERESVPNVHQTIRNYYRNVNLDLPDRVASGKGIAKNGNPIQSAESYDSDSLPSDDDYEDGLSRSDFSPLDNVLDTQIYDSDDDSDVVVGVNFRQPRRSPRKLTKTSEEPERSSTSLRVGVEVDAAKNDDIFETSDAPDHDNGNNDVDLCLTKAKTTRLKTRKTTKKIPADASDDDDELACVLESLSNPITRSKRKRTIKRAVSRTSSAKTPKASPSENTAASLKTGGPKKWRKRYTVNGLNYHQNINSIQRPDDDEEIIQLKKDLQCNICFHQSFSRGGYDYHAKQHNQPQSKLFCVTCNLPFTNAKILRAHLQTEHPEKFKVNRKPKTWTRRRGQKSLFRCEKCDFSTVAKTTFSIHQRNHNITENSEDLSGNRFRCKLCGHEGLNYKNQLFDHMKGKHAEEIGFQIIMCHQCDKTFTSPPALKMHMAMLHGAEKMFICPTCGAGFINKAYYEDHLEEHINNGKLKKICEACGMALSSTNTFKRHIQVFHPELYQGGPRRQRVNLRQQKRSKDHKKAECTCSHCGVQVVHVKALKLHLKNVHTELFKFKCDLCEEGLYMRAQSLKIHKEVKHMEQVPLICEFCNRTIKRAIYMTDHKKKYCDKCPTSLAYKGSSIISASSSSGIPSAAIDAAKA